MKKLFFLISILAAFAAGVYVGRSSFASVVVESVADSQPMVAVPAGTAQQPSSTEQSAATEGSSITVETSRLSLSQRDFLSRLGINADAIVITPEMIACAEAKVGSARVQEIQGGATPSFTEGASLLACYR